MRYSVVTPWYNQPQFVEPYKHLVSGFSEVIIVDNGSAWETRLKLNEAADEQGWTVLRQNQNRYFAGACNIGLAAATGDVIIMLNNDVIPISPWWLQVAHDVRLHDVLYGVVEKDVRISHLHTVTYLEGWCLAATSQTWGKLGGFDADLFTQPYYEDVELCWRAAKQHGMQLQLCNWGVRHLGNGTSKHMPHVIENVPENARKLEIKMGLWELANGGQ